MNRISVETSNVLFPTSPLLYGLFFEDINRAGDSGLYPEMLRNRTFEDSLPPKDFTTDDEKKLIHSPTGWTDEFNHGEGLSRWQRQSAMEETDIPAWYADNAEMQLDNAYTLNKNRSVSLNVDFKAGGALCNIGYCGVSVKEGESYRFLAFLQAEKPVRLLVSLVGQGNSYAAQELTVCGSGFIRYDAVLTSRGTDNEAALKLECPEGGSVRFGYVSCMPAKTYNGHGLREDLVKKLKALHPAFLRFPGGCIVEGASPETVMLFKNTIGPAWERPGHLLVWHYRSTNGLGFHEYLQLCEDLDMEPMYVCNCGMTCQARNAMLLKEDTLDEILEDALNALEYALGSRDSTYGRIRAQMGHPAPFKMNFMEIGNENSGSAYEERYQLFFKEIRRRYPHIHLVANSHVEEKGYPADMVDEHFYNSTEYFAEHTHYYDNYDRSAPEIFVGEQAVTVGYTAQQYAAVGEAAFMIGMERNQDLVKMVAYAPLFENVSYTAWFPNLIRFNNHASYGIPSYYVWKMFGENRGESVLAVKEESERIFRPMKGLASFFGKQGLRFRNAEYNGAPVSVSHEILGRVSESNGESIVTEPDAEQLEELKHCPPWFSADSCMLVFGDESMTEGSFSADILLGEDMSMDIGIFSARTPHGFYVSDESNPPKEWNVTSIRPLLWRLQGGISTIEERQYPTNVIMAEAVGGALKEGQYNHFRYETDGKTINAYINGALVHRVDIPSFPTVTSAATLEKDSIFIKATNISGEEKPIEICLDCEVLSEYTVQRTSGAQTAANDFEKPKNIGDIEVMLRGASSRFTYNAPAYSVNVLKLTRK